MDARFLRLKSPEDCESFAENVEAQYPALALEARRRAVELRAAAYGARTDAEREALEAVYAYQEVLSRKNGKKTRASRTWQMIERHGILEAVERAVNRKAETVGYTSLLEVGMQDYAFENVVLRHAALFRPETVSLARARFDEWNEP
jgi:hypothetical protein